MPQQRRFLVSASADRTARVWEVEKATARAQRSIAQMKEDLLARNADCLPQPLRVERLDEPRPLAEWRYRECERAHGRPRSN